MNGEANAWYHRNKHKDRPDEIIPLLEELSIEFSDGLEFGCADGRRLGEMRKLYPATRLTGIDPSRDAILRASQKYPTIKFLQDTARMNDGWDHYDLIIYGFCLYLCDCHEIQTIASQGNMMLREGGYLIIHDFDPDYPHRIAYEHEEGLFSYKMDYSQLWLSNPAYHFVKKIKPTEETGVWVLHKNTSDGWPLETLR